MEKPLLVGYLPDRAARTAVREIEADWQSVTPASRIPTTEYPRPPRLFVIQTGAAEADQTLSIVQTLGQERPMTDVLVWAPLVSGATVRSLFLAGAKDVVVSRSPAQLVKIINEILQAQQILPRLNQISRQQSRGSRFESMLSRSVAMWDLFELCSRVAPADATVLIIGETGTGKELLARAVHRRSQRSGRFVAANCASIPAELINSELFGHEKGAFTGADRAKKGLVAYAHQGTLFLDEIGDIPPETQLSLLRMLQERRIRPVGSLVETKVDVRVVAATNAPLDQAVREGTFREDLFYRLDVIRMNVPPLRDRPEDILFLFGHFIKRLSKHYGLPPPTFADSFLDALSDYAWPGNVRQLENFVERLVLGRPQKALTARDFAKLRSTQLTDSERHAPRSRDTSGKSIDNSKTLAENIGPLVEELEKQYFESVLRHHQGRVTAAADRAGVSRRTLLRKMKQYNIDKQSFKDTRAS